MKNKKLFTNSFKKNKFLCVFDSFFQSILANLTVQKKFLNNIYQNIDMNLIISGKNTINLKQFFFLSLVLLFALQFQNVHAVKSIDWYYFGGTLGSSEAPYDTVDALIGNIVDGLPLLTVIVDASDEENFSSNGVVDTIDVLITSNAHSQTTYTLIETEPNTGIFQGEKFVFLNEKFQFKSKDKAKVIFYENKTLSDCDDDDTITYVDTRNNHSAKGITVVSDTDPFGIGFLLTETGKNTCKFTGELNFTLDEPSDATNGTLKVSEGDILGFETSDPPQITNAQIVPTVDGKGSILAYFDPDDDENTAEVTATYNGLSSGLNLESPYVGPGGGGGGGGPVNPGLVLNFIRALLGGSSASAPPTVGVDGNQNRIVEQGFSFNGNPVDVEQFYTPYPLITTKVGELNTVKLKIYEERGNENIAHVGLSYGLGKGESFTQGRATIEWDKTFDGKESITLFDPNHVLGQVNVTTSTIDCSSKNNAKCLEITFDHIFRESLEYNMLATNIWDYQRNGWQNYFNHGIEITGDSMNPPDVYTGIYKGHIYELTETGKNTAIDTEGNSWTFSKIWTRDYIKPEIHERNVFNQQKIQTIEKLGFNQTTGKEIFGFSRTDHGFSEILKQEEIEAKKILKNMCPECQEDSFTEINGIFAYDMPKRYSKLTDPNNITQIIQEKEKAQEFLKQYLREIYPGKYH